MSQNQLITLLTIVLLLVIFGSIFVLLNTSEESSLPTTTEAPAATTTRTENLFPLEILERQSYQLLNKQLVKEGALPVPPPPTVGKANPFI